MEEPDEDELEWMAQADFPDEDGFEPPEDLEDFEEVPEPSKKRAPEAPPEQEEAGPLPALFPKKPRTEDAPGPSQSRAASFRHWSPPRPTFDDEDLPSTSGRQASRSPAPKSSPNQRKATWSPPKPPHEEDNEGVASPNGRPRSPPPAKKLSRIAAEIEGECMPITGPNGERVYAQMDDSGAPGGGKPSSARLLRELFREPGAKSGALGGKPLLGEPIEKLIERVEQDRLEQAIKDSEVLAQKQQAELEVDSEVLEDAQEERLWVDKYAPRSFTELLSDEQTNREVLRWLKQWDPCVFHRPSRSPSSFTAPIVPQGGGFHSQGGRGSSFLRGGQGNAGLDWRNLREGKFGGGRGSSDAQNGGRGPHVDSQEAKTKEKGDGRPEQKVLLMCGAPGLGKTTLAHVAAQHCGYRVVEVNASDDRSANTLRERILDAVQMRPVMGDRRPNCVVIDEIDGALNGAEGKGAIDALLAIVNAGGPGSSPANEEAAEKPAGKKKRKKNGVKKLCRPVICICNDMYAPALRQLRQVAKVFVFAPPLPSRLATRLRFICTRESYRTDTRALTALCEHTECDVRACLNTLQFLHRKGKALRLTDISSQVVGRKDMTHNIFEIWQELFQRKKPKAVRSAIDSSLGLTASSAEQREFHRVHNLLSGYGDHDFVMDGVHENFARMRYHEGTLQKTVECLRWMGDSDCVSRRVHTRQQFFLMAYQPAMLQAIRRHVANPERPHIEFPRAYKKFRSDFSSQKQLLQSWQLGMDPCINRALNPSSVIQDVVSPLLHIMAPPTLRPVASQLLSEKEKLEVSELVDTMIRYGFTYKNEAGFGVNPAAGPQIDPALQRLVAFGERPPQHRELTITLRQMLAHEVSLQIIRREGAVRAARAAALNPSNPAGASKSPSKPQDDVCKAPVIPDKSSERLQRVNGDGGQKMPSEVPPQKMQDKKPTAKVVRPAAKPYVNFFEKFKKPSAKRTGTEDEPAVQSVTNVRDAMPVLYKYHEGFTNAVRRPVLMKDLLR